jgi:hypothetical protein
MEIKSSALKRRNTTAIPPRLTKVGELPVRSNSTSRSPRQQSQFRSHFGIKAGGWNELGETSSNSLNEDDEDDPAEDGGEWGLRKGMELFEVSSKDDSGQLFLKKSF